MIEIEVHFYRRRERCGERRGGRARRAACAAAVLLLGLATPGRGQELHLTLREAVRRALSEGTAARIAGCRIAQVVEFLYSLNAARRYGPRRH